jgi:hypothetical protein
LNTDTEFADAGFVGLAARSAAGELPVSFIRAPVASV